MRSNTFQNNSSYSSPTPPALLNEMDNAPANPTFTNSYCTDLSAYYRNYQRHYLLLCLTSNVYQSQLLVNMFVLQLRITSTTYRPVYTKIDKH
ncbi:MAG: hypothetical protein EZS28_013188 [Streblomastix strix]|uniref:Uncharacterized protein n=1 Tax=Streblomastix strix TaxID=222440 RepID=A0A5J4W8Q0_9EUKA|nr:MAG: hypothetical protein EZS28_013188 [Streblomastix strix]